MPLEPIVSIMFDWEITNTRIGTIIITTVEAADRACTGNAAGCDLADCVVKSFKLFGVDE